MSFKVKLRGDDVIFFFFSDSKSSLFFTYYYFPVTFRLNGREAPLLGLKTHLNMLYSYDHICIISIVLSM